MGLASKLEKTHTPWCRLVPEQARIEPPRKSGRLLAISGFSWVPRLMFAMSHLSVEAPPADATMGVDCPRLERTILTFTPAHGDRLLAKMQASYGNSCHHLYKQDAAEAGIRSSARCTFRREQRNAQRERRRSGRRRYSSVARFSHDFFSVIAYGNSHIGRDTALGCTPEPMHCDSEASTHSVAETNTQPGGC